MKTFSHDLPLLLEKSLLAPLVTRYVFRAPAIAHRRKAGQFVMVRLHEGGERIPLTIVDSDERAGTITLIVQEVGKTTAEMAATLRVGESVLDLVGPLGQPTHIEQFGRVVAVGGGIGIAPLYPIARALRDAGNEVVAILGARTRELLILEAEMRATTQRVRVATDDGSYGRQGLVTDALRDEVEEHGHPDLCVVIGPLVMMRAVAEATRPWGVPTVASLNPVMVDGTGMCGGCRITVGGEVKFACVDGPEFDAHGVDFDEAMRRQAFYREQEREAYEAYLEARRRDPERRPGGQLEGPPGGCRALPKEAPLR